MKEPSRLEQAFEYYCLDGVVLKWKFAHYDDNQAQQLLADAGDRDLNFV